LKKRSEEKAQRLQNPLPKTTMLAGQTKRTLAIAAAAATMLKKALIMRRVPQRLTSRARH
jgi:hypothetical protein